MSETTTRKVGDHVSGGADDDHDAGTITAIGGQCEDSHPMNQPGNVYVSWDSGVETWTPESVLS